MSDTVVFSGNILDIALWVKNPIWPLFVQGQAINSYHFRHNRGRFVFLVFIHGVFRYAVHSGAVGKYFRHCLMRKTSRMSAICSRSSNKCISFSTL